MESQQTDESIVVPIIVFSLASFIGNFGVAVTGFGMGIIFLFVYTIADLANLVECSKCTFKDAVFFQTLALGSAIPLLLYQLREIIKEYRSKELLMTFLPATVVGTPVGNFLQDHIPSDILRTIVGVVITVLICYQLTKIVPKSEMYQRLKLKEKRGEKAEDTITRERELVSQKSDENDNNGKEEDIEETSTAEKDTENHQSKKQIVVDAEMNNISPNLLALVDQNEEKEGKFALQEKDDDDNDQIAIMDVTEKVKEEVNIPTGKKLRIWGFILGFLSGFMGGLMGIR